MSALGERLRRLGRQSGAAATAPSPSTASAGEIAALRRLLGVRERRIGATVDAGPQPEWPGREIVPGLHQVVRQLPWDGSLAALRPPRWPRPEAVLRQRFVCFDTETTGLAGGTGTRAFMIGAADWHGGGLRVRQLLITTLAAEAAMLRIFASWLDADTVLVSYNGRSYDAPLLAARYRLARQTDPLRGRCHVDLLGAVRRRYRGQWPDCRLATVERRLLGVVREDDLPGAKAPAAWLACLRHGHRGDLLRVLAHNHQDVVSLARLLEALHEDLDMEPIRRPSWVPASAGS